jgi:hypothetical protein
VTTARRTATILATAAIALIAALTGCGPASQPVTYAPAAYGVPGHCYYVDSPAEALALESAGLCPRSWAPTLMPLAWHEEYWDYYDSPVYYTRYVPVSTRTVYVHQQATFGHTYHSAILTRSRTATYRSSSGTVVKGSQVTGKTRFGSGTSFGTSGAKYGGGSLRGGTLSRSGSSSSSSSHSSSHSGGFGGGSLRSGGHR